MYWLARPPVNSNIMIANEIEQIYNENWKNRGVLPYEKYELVNLIVKGRFQLLDRVNFTILKTSEVLDGISSQESRRRYKIGIHLVVYSQREGWRLLKSILSK
jgi:hypothetical protein